MKRAAAVSCFGGLWMGAVSCSTPLPRGYAVGAAGSGSTSTSTSAGSGSTALASNAATATAADAAVAPMASESSGLDASLAESAAPDAGEGDASDPAEGRCEGDASTCDASSNVLDACGTCETSTPTGAPPDASSGPTLSATSTMLPPVMSSAPVVDECLQGQTQGSEVAVIGDSFIAVSRDIPQRIEQRAQEAGSLAEDEHYLDNSVSGKTLANNQIPSQYDAAVASSGTIKYVLMNGGGTDCQVTNGGDAALAAAETLFANMAQNNTQKVVYFFSPDPIGAAFATVKECLDTLRPQMKALCEGLTAPKCYFLDLREVWDGHGEYTSDGLHPTAAGANATGDAIWNVMAENCVAQ